MAEGRYFSGKNVKPAFGVFASKNWIGPTSLTDSVKMFRSLDLFSLS